MFLPFEILFISCPRYEKMPFLEAYIVIIRFLPEKVKILILVFYGTKRLVSLLCLFPFFNSSKNIRSLPSGLPSPLNSRTSV